MTLTQEYEPKRDLLTSMLYKRSNTELVQRSYTYDALGRPLTRTTSRNNATVTDTFGYNTRSELTSAQVNNATYAYDYDNIGNRLSSQSSAGAEADAAITEYTANQLNQYTMLSVDDLTDFIPDYDADGNQTRVKTSTGIWAISYDAENRPTDFTKVDTNGSTTIHCEYDHMGRRATKQVTTNGETTLHQRYIYRGYLQIACCDLTGAAHPSLWLITWDPTQPIATRPLAIQKDATWYTYGWDLTKNICEVYGQHGYIRTAYAYAPYGQVTAEGDVTQPIQWSSEMYDDKIGVSYYNYRCYNAYTGNWCVRDFIHEADSINLYAALNNTPIMYCDYNGLWVNVGSSLYRAEYGDSLRGLAKKLTDSEEDWPCLWPNRSYRNKTMKDRYPNVCPGDIYDASNLTDTRTNKATFVIERDFKSVAMHYDSNAKVVQASRLPIALKNKAEEGANPISHLAIFGHGNKNGRLAGKAYLLWFSSSVSITNFHSMNYEQTYERARRKKGPIRCWFKRKSEARFVAFHSTNFASSFANLALRKTAYAVGANQIIGIKVHGSLLSFGYDYKWNQRENRMKFGVIKRNTT